MEKLLERSDNMNCYETIIIFNGKLPTKKYNTLVTKYADHIMSLGGKIKTTDKLGKKKLAYPIKDTEDGWYVVFTYYAKPDALSELERLMRIDDDAVKFISLRRDEEEDELSEYLKDEYITPKETPADSNSVESEQSSSGSLDCWDKVFDLKEV